MLQKRIARFVSAILIFGMFSPITTSTTAGASDTITKTYTIKKANGTTYVGALVQVYYYNSVTGDEVYMPPMTTDASGVARFTVPIAMNYLQYQVMPATGDLSNAVLTGQGDGAGENPYIDESVTLQLNPATIVVQIFQPDGTTPGELNYSNVCYPVADTNYGNSCAWQTRTGAFGIYLPSSLSGDYVLRVRGNPLQASPNQFWWKYGIRTSGTSDNRTFTVYTDPTNTTVYAAEGGVYKLVLGKGNLRVQLKDQGGNNITIPSGVVASYLIEKLDSHGVVDNSQRAITMLTNGGIATNGSFIARTVGLIAGKYQVEVWFEGSNSLTSFDGYYWVDSSGRFSSTESGTYEAGTFNSPYQLNLTVPAANFKANITKPGTSNPDSGWLWIVSKTSKMLFARNFAVVNGKIALKLPVDSYYMTFSSDDSDIGMSSFGLDIASGSTTLSDSANLILAPTGGIYSIEGSPTNIHLVAMDPAGSTVVPNAGFNIFRGADGSGGYVTNVQTAQRYGSTQLANGTYQIQAYANSNAYASQKYVLTVTSGIGTVAGHAAVNGVIPLPLRTANIQLKLVDEHGVPSNGWVEICQDTNQGPYQTGSCDGFGFDGKGIGGTAGDTGSYYLKIHPSSPTQAVRIYPANVDAAGIATVTGATKVDNVWVVTGATPNFLMEVTHPVTNALISEGWISIEQIDSNGNWLAWLPNADLNSNNPGEAQAYIPNGKYLVKVNVNSGVPAVAGLAARTYNLDVSNGVATLTSSGSPVSKNVDATRYVVSPASSNVKIRLVDGTGTALTNSWFDVCEDLGFGPDKTGNCDGYGVDQNGEWSVNIPTGSWYVRVNPGPTYALATKIYAVTVDGSGVATFTGASQSGTTWVLPAATPNVSGTFATSTGDPLAFTNGQGISLNLQKFNNSNNNWEWTNGGQWRTSDTFGMKVTDAGHYRLVAQPNGFSDLSVTYSNEFWVDGSGKVSASEHGSYANSLSDFQIRMKSPNVKFEVQNPIDSTLLKYGWISILKIDPSNNNQSWIGNADLNAQNPGLTGFYLEDGTYRLEVNPQYGATTISGLSRANYKAVVSSSGASVVITGFSDTQPVEKDADRFIVNPLTSNITGRVTSSSGNPLTFGKQSWIQANVQKLDANSNWQWTDKWFFPGADGFFSTNVSTAGTYRLRIEPQGFQNASVTISDSFVITDATAATYKKDFGNIALSSPDLLVNVETSTGTEILNNIGIEIRQNDQWLDWANTGNGGTASISFADAGIYSLLVHPNTDQMVTGSTSHQYEVTVTKDTNGAKTATVTAGAGVSSANGITTIRLGAAALSGTVIAPVTSLAVPNAQVVAIDAKGMEMWQYSVNTSADGKWAMSLPQGVYRLQARSPWGTSSYGNGDQLGTVTIAADGNATLSGPSLNGLDKLALALQLKAPTWSGTVYDPASNPIAFAQICLVSGGPWICTTSNALGEWALSAPTGFASFDANAALEIADVQQRSFPALRFDGASAVSTALGGLTATGLVHHLPSPNTSITLTAGGNPAAGIWVNLEKTGGGWIGGNVTDSNGVAKFYLSNSDIVQELRVRAEINGNPTYSTNYSSTTHIIAAASGRTTISETVALPTPNIRGILREPTVAGVVGAIDPNTWVELMKDNGQGGWDWVSGTNTDNQGLFSLYAPPPGSGSYTYIVRVNPQWNSSSNSSAMQYNAVIDSASHVTMTTRDLTPSQTVSTETHNGNQFYSFTLAAPSVNGVVLNPTGQATQNSWINPFDVTNNQWLNGANSKLNGSFGLALPNGSYRIEANPPWNVSNVAKSSPCSVTITAGAVSSGGSCVQPDKSIQLQLNAPNVTFTLKSGTDVMAYAHVGMGLGAWNTWAQADENGVISLYVDTAAIAQLNPGLTGTNHLWVWVDPPYGSSNKMVRWDCASGDTTKPICTSLPDVTIGTAYAGATLGDVQVAKPNTVLHIKKSDGTTSIGANAWVMLVGFTPGDGTLNWVWQGWASTDSSGDAWFNVDSSTATADTRWGVEINPPYDQRQTQTVNEIGTYQQANDWAHGLTWSQLNSQTLSSMAPNLVVNVKTPADVANRYGWTSIEEVNPTDNSTVSWKNGTNLDFTGSGSLFLSSNKRYRITAYPNGGTGTATSCYLDTSNASPTSISKVTGKCDAGSLAGSILTMTLDAGNVTGTVLDSANIPVAGAVVVAMVGVDETTAVTTTTMDNGRFGLNLDLSKTWSVLVIPTGTVLKNSSRITVTTADMGTIKLDNR